MDPAASSPSTGISLFILEFGFVCLALALSLCSGRRKSKLFTHIERPFKNLARRRALSVGVIGLLAACTRVCFLPRIPIPQPFLTSDFSFLLAADTFSRGRLANSPHPMWVHFESLHIDQFPTYMSMYFPAQGILLAAGKVIANHPWWGVWASVALMCAAICWMLQAWLPPGWALLGGVLAVFRLGLFSYWIDSYSGGAIPAIGGALVIGALPRVLRHWRARDFFWAALGIVLLINSRPYEGALICAPVVFVLGCYLLLKRPSRLAQLADTLTGRQFHTRRPPAHVLVRRVAPATLLLILNILAIAYYNHRVFGNAFTLPYTINRATYAVAPHFWFQSPRPEPVYSHADMRNFYASWELEPYLKMRTPLGLVKNTVQKALIGESFYLGFALALPFLAFSRVLRDKRTRFLLLSAAVFLVGLAAETWLLPHYAAPFTAVLYALMLQSMRHLRAWRPGGRASGVFLVRAVPATCILLAGLRLYAQPLYIALPEDVFCGKGWFGTEPRGLARAQVVKQLESDPGAQLALVRYSSTHNPVKEWVYNAADIDRSKIVWAHDMGPEKNRELLRYYKDRQVWLVEPDFNPPRILPYADYIERLPRETELAEASTGMPPKGTKHAY